MPWEIILTVVLTLLPSLGLGGIIVAIFNHYSGKKKEIEQAQRERKEEQYREFLENAVGFFSGWEDRKKKEKFLKELYTHAPLYASGKVIRAANQFVSSLDAKGFDAAEDAELEITVPYIEPYGKLFSQKDGAVFRHVGAPVVYENLVDGTGIEAIHRGKVAITPIDLRLATPESVRFLQDKVGPRWNMT